MENRESESELNECKKKLNKAHQTIEELKIKMTQDKKNYKWEIRELNKEKDALKAHNTDLFNRESNALIRADDLEKENIPRCNSAPHWHKKNWKKRTKTY